MFSTTPFYHHHIRNVIVGFGSLFSGIKITRQKDNTPSGLDQTINVPISYAPKEKWVQRIEGDPNLTKNTYTLVPRLSFEIIGYTFDPTRKLNKNNKLTCNNVGSSRKEVYVGTPYDIEINLYILAKNTEDSLQILEQILPYFSPEYTLSIKEIPEMNIENNVPIVLNSVDFSDQYDGSFEERRFVTHTLSFTAKTILYGPMSNVGVINTAIANISGGINLHYKASSSAPTQPIVEIWSGEEFVYVNPNALNSNLATSTSAGGNI